MKKSWERESEQSKQHEREVLEQSQQIATMKSLITKMEEDVRGLKEENRMLRLRTLVELDANKDLPARSTSCKTDTQVHTTAVHDMELRLLGRLIEVQKDVEYIKDCRKSDHVDYAMDNTIYQDGKYPHSGLRKHAERTRPSRERYSQQKTSKWKSGADRRNTSRQSQYQSKRWNSASSHTEYSSRYSPPNSQLHTKPIISDNQPQIYEYRHGQSTNKTLGNVQPKVDKNLSLPSVGDLAHATINTSVHNPVATIEHASNQNNLRGRTQSKPVYQAGQAAIKRSATNVVTNHDSSCATTKQHHSSSSFLCGTSPPNWWM